MNEYLLQEFKVLILDGYYNAKHAHSVIFSEKSDNSVAIGHLAIANSYINSARAIYVCNAEQLSRSEFDDFFHDFNAFSDEVMTNIRSNHSHQWSDIHFNMLEQKFNAVASLLGVK